MKLKLLLLFVFVGCFCDGFGQQQNVYFFRNPGIKVKTRDSADFIRIISEPDSGTTLYAIKEYYKNGNPMLIGKSSKKESLWLEGECTTYYPSGKKQQQASYKASSIEGDAYSYFPNGMLYTHIKYLPRDHFSVADSYSYELILACNDSTGKELVKNGNGHYIGYRFAFKEINEEGDLKNGIRDGRWTRYNRVGSLGKVVYEEYYKEGKFLSGKSTDNDGKVTTYLKREDEPEFNLKSLQTTHLVYASVEHEPEFKGGIQAFYAFLAQNIVYPANARKRNITGKVFVQFIVEKDGSLSEVHAVRDSNDELSPEAERVVKLSPNWIPGTQNGRLVRVQYTVPINFNLTK
ncbi:MAG: TonB family protein [Mucilaginibacter sp.]